MSLSFFLNAFWKAILWLLIILLLSLTSGNNIPKISTSLPIDKIVHFIMYFAFVVFLLVGFYQYLNPVKIKQQYIYSGIIAFLTGIIFEVLQMNITTTRHAEWFDILANTTGVIAGLIFFNALKRVAGPLLFLPVLKNN